MLKVWASKLDGEAVYVMLGIEEQTQTDYGMAVRCALFDAISYAGQISSIKASYERERKRRRGEADSHAPDDPDVVVEDGVAKIKLTGKEFLSGMRATDRLVPVVTAVVYLGTESWDGPLSLHETLDMPNERVARLVPDYRLNLVSPADMADGEFDKFQTDLGFAFKVLAHRASDADEVIGDAGHRQIDRATAKFLNAVADLKLEYVEEEGGVDMCLAMENRMRRVYDEGVAKGREETRDEALAEGLAKGREEGLAEGLAKGRDEGLAEGLAKGREETLAEDLAKGAVKMGILMGMSANEIVDTVAENYGVDREYVEELIRAQSA